MYCPNCGTNVNDNAEVCSQCGTNLHNLSNNINANNTNTTNTVTVNDNDKANIWINLLSLCCFPILGIIMYFVWKDSQPKAAKSALIFGIVGICLSVVVGILSFILGIAIGFMEDDSYYY